MDVVFTLADNVVNVNFEDLPSDAVSLTKKEIMDILGVSVAGSNAPGVEELTPGGLGVQLIYQAFDEVLFDAPDGGGNRVTMRLRSPA